MRGLGRLLLPLVMMVILVAGSGASAAPTISLEKPVNLSLPTGPEYHQPDYSDGADVDGLLTKYEEAADVGADILPAGCLSYSAHNFTNKRIGGDGKTWVVCTPDKARNVSIEQRIMVKDLNSSSRWTQYGQTETKSCRLGIWPLKCTMVTDFNPAGTHARLFKVVASVTVDGRNGIPIAQNALQRVYNRRGEPYPKIVLMPRGEVPFPTLVGPWTGGDPRNQATFNRECAAKYREMRWDRGLPGYLDGSVPYVDHHVHPLGHGGRNNGYTNCYKLTPQVHINYFNDWWAGFNP